MGANEIKRLLHRALVLLDEMDEEPTSSVKPLREPFCSLDDITTQPVVLPNSEPSVVEPPALDEMRHPALASFENTTGLRSVNDFLAIKKYEVEPTPAQEAAQDALSSVKPQTLANAANEAFVDMAALAATLPPEHPLSALVPAAEPPRQRKRKVGIVDTPTQAVASPEEVRAALPMIQTPQQNLAPLTVLPAQAVEPPKVEKLLNPEQEKEIKERLAKYRNEVLPAGGMVPVDQIGGVESQLRKFVAQFNPAKPSSKTWDYMDWKKFVDFFDDLFKIEGPAALVHFIQQRIGIVK